MRLYTNPGRLQPRHTDLMDFLGGQVWMVAHVVDVLLVRIVVVVIVSGLRPWPQRALYKKCMGVTRMPYV